MSKVTITISGEFTPVELMTMVAFIRQLDRDGRHWDMMINDEGSTLKEAEALLRQILPDMEGRETKIEAHRKQ